jgi:hypothetical protein
VRVLEALQRSLDASVPARSVGAPGG